MSTSLPSETLLAARRRLNERSSIKLLQDWTWNDQVKKWILHCRIQLEDSTHLIPQFTDWYILADPSYPWGQIEFYPAKQGGISLTFPHQMFNGEGEPELPWRDGNLCLNTNFHLLARYGNEIEPFDSDERLIWHFDRAIAWLQAANTYQLTRNGDPFELPHFPITSLTTISFSENATSLQQWQAEADQVGIVDLGVLRHQPNVLFVKCFRSLQGKVLQAPSWGRIMAHLDTPIRALWLRLPQTPVLPSWQVPKTWGEFRTACRKQTVELDALLRLGLRVIRDGQPHFMLIGFPIPERVGDALYQMHWQPLQLPTLSTGIKTANGFRPNEAGHWRRDHLMLLHRNAPLRWVMGENWHSQQISNRGKLPKTITQQKVTVLGAGALGSAIAELLVRNGVNDAQILDADFLQAGNLTRHPLDLRHLQKRKAEGVAERLNWSSPHADVKSFSCNFPPEQETVAQLIQQSSWILDCTGNDLVLHSLEQFNWETPKVFISVSLGLEGKRLFCFMTVGTHFSHSVFRTMMNPWLQQELEEYADKELPREGIGCWHPVFPARIDDVWMLASVAIKHIEALLKSPLSGSSLAIFEQQYEDGMYSGIRRVSLEFC